MRSLGDYSLASDIMQESFTRYLERYGEKQQQVSLLYTIGRNLIFDNYRRRRRDIRVQKEQNDNADDPERLLMVREAYRHVMKALQRLDNDERDILSLAVNSELSYQKIAQITGISEANVKVKVHRARLKLKKIIQAGKL